MKREKFKVLGYPVATDETMPRTEIRIGPVELINLCQPPCNHSGPRVYVHGHMECGNCQEVMR